MLTVPLSGLPEILRRAPGPVSVPALSLAVGTSPYEMGREVQAVLQALHRIGKPMIFSGTFGQLQAVLNGGPGCKNDPLNPVVLHLPEISAEPFFQFLVHQTAGTAGGRAHHPVRIETL